MISEKRYYAKIHDKGIGPGGWDCPCCGPAPSWRHLWVRRAKRGVEKRFFERYVEESLSEDVEVDGDIDE